MENNFVEWQEENIPEKKTPEKHITFFVLITL